MEPRQGFQGRARAHSATVTLAAAALVAVGASPALAAPAKAPPSQVGKVITINHGIGKLTPGLGPGAVRKLLGAPNRTARATDDAGKRRVLRMDYKRYGLSLLFELDATQPNVVAVIDVKSPKYHTTGGVHVKSTKAALLRAHPETSCALLSGGKPGEEVCSIQGDGMQTTFVTTKAQRIRTIEMGTA